MKLRKITIGYVIQVFDTDKGEFIQQEFVAGDVEHDPFVVEWENDMGEPVDCPENERDLNFDMIQPKKK